MPGEQQSDQQQHRRGERPAYGGGTHCTEYQRRDVSRRRRPARSRARAAACRRNASPGSTKIVNRRITSGSAEGGGCDRQRGHEIRNVQQCAVAMPVGSDATGEDDDDEHGHVEDDAAPQGRIATNVRCVMTAVARKAAKTMAPANPTTKPASLQYALNGLSRPSPTVSMTFSAMTSRAGANTPCNTVTNCISIPKSFRPSPTRGVPNHPPQNRGVSRPFHPAIARNKSLP